MATDRKMTVRLSDGSSCEVSERQYQAIAELTQTVDLVARGVVRNLSIVQNDGGEGTRQTWYVFTGERQGLDHMADALVHQSKWLRRTAAAWEGNAPAGARSRLEH